MYDSPDSYQAVRDAFARAELQALFLPRGGPCLLPGYYHTDDFECLVRFCCEADSGVQYRLCFAPQSGKIALYGQDSPEHRATPQIFTNSLAHALSVHFVGAPLSGVEELDNSMQPAGKKFELLFHETQPDEHTSPRKLIPRNAYLNTRHPERSDFNKAIIKEPDGLISLLLPGTSRSKNMFAVECSFDDEPIEELVWSVQRWTGAVDGADIGIGIYVTVSSCSCGCNP
jgi:hypothetical protein